MRRLLLLLALFTLAILPSYAQFGFGPEIGIGMSSMHFAPPTAPILYTQASVSDVFSGKVGALVELPVNRHVYVQAGLSFSRKGAVKSFSYHSSDSFNESVHQTLYINYADLPVTVMYKSGTEGKGRFIVGLGATASYIIGGRNMLQDNQVYGGVTSNTSDNVKISVGNTLHGFDIGVNVSAGYELPSGLFFRGYYTVGVNDIGIRTETDKNRMWGIAAGYLFGKARKKIQKEAESLIDKSTL